MACICCETRFVLIEIIPFKNVSMVHWSSALNNIIPSSAKTRQGALDGLKTAMATKILHEFILERRMTITDSIERCLKKGL